MVADGQVFVLLGAAAMLNAIWSTLSVQLLAANKQGSFAWTVLLLYAVCAFLPIIPKVQYLAVLGAIALSEALILFRIVISERKI
jgi:hypothetical protein